MKIYLEGSALSDTLGRIEKQANKRVNPDYIAEINKGHRCVDILKKDDEGSSIIVAQIYPKETSVNKNYDSLERVDPKDINPGDIIYRKVSKKGNHKSYSSKNPYVKFVSKTDNGLKNLLKGLTKAI